MMRKGLKILSAAAAAALCAAFMSACNTYSSEGDWDNTLPLITEKASAGSVEVITDTSALPISIEMPEKTETSTSKGTELATSLSEDVPETTTTTVTTTVAEDPFSGIPTVHISEYNPAMSTTVSTVSSRVFESPAPVSSGNSLLSTESGDTSAQTEQKEPSYIFNDPISRPYCYSTLSEKKRSLYDIVIKAIKEHKEWISIPSSLGISKEDYEDVYQMIYNSEHSVYYIGTNMRYGRNVDTNCVVSAELSYIYTQDEIDTMQKKIDEKAKKIISEITEDMTEYDIIKLFFDRLVEGCVYDIDAVNCRDIYGCLVNGRAVCGGYAKAFSYLCDKVGITSLTITGDFENVPHMWNMVKAGGEWYHIDVTSGWVGNSATNYIRYDYFLVDDLKNGRTHKAYEQNYPYPAANASKYNYYVYNGLVARSYESAYNILVEEMVAASSKGVKMVQVMCADDDVFEEVAYEFFDESRKRALKIYEDAYARADKKFVRYPIVFNQDSSTGVIKLFIEYTD